MHLNTDKMAKIKCLCMKLVEVGEFRLEGFQGLGGGVML